MPYIELTVDPKPTSTQALKLAQEITDAMVSVVGKRREVTAVRIIGNEALLWTIDALPFARTSAYLEVKITQNSNTEQQKATLIAHLHQILYETFGELEEASYIVINELPAENWGYAGLTQANRTTQQGAKVCVN